MRRRAFFATVLVLLLSEVHGQGVVPGGNTYCPTNTKRFQQGFSGTCTLEKFTCTYSCSAPSGVNQDPNGGGIAKYIACGCTGQLSQTSFDETSLLCQAISQSYDLFNFCANFQTAYMQLKQKYSSCYKVDVQTFLDAWGCKGVPVPPIVPTTAPPPPVQPPPPPPRPDCPSTCQPQARNVPIPPATPCQSQCQNGSLIGSAGVQGSWDPYSCSCTAGGVTTCCSESSGKSSPVPRPVPAPEPQLETDLEECKRRCAKSTIFYEYGGCAFCSPYDDGSYDGKVPQTVIDGYKFCKTCGCLRGGGC